MQKHFTSINEILTFLLYFHIFPNKLIIKDFFPFDFVAETFVKTPFFELTFASGSHIVKIKNPPHELNLKAWVVNLQCSARARFSLGISGVLAVMCSCASSIRIWLDKF